jgi:hypothetical protein
MKMLKINVEIEIKVKRLIGNHIPNNVPADTSVPTAPDIPQAVKDKLQSGKGHAKMRAHLSRLDTEDEAALQAKQIELLEICQHVLDRMNPHTRKHREAILFTWGLTLQSLASDLHEELYWTLTVVMKYARFYLRWRVSHIFQIISESFSLILIG